MILKLNTTSGWKKIDESEHYLYFLSYIDGEQYNEYLEGQLNVTVKNINYIFKMDEVEYEN